MEHTTSPTSSTPTSSAALTTTLLNSIQALGRGFDVTNDIRLLYCKGAPGSRLIQFDEHHTRDLVVNDTYLHNVSIDVDCSRGKPSRETTPVCSFQELGVGAATVLHFPVSRGVGDGLRVGFQIDNWKEIGRSESERQSELWEELCTESTMEVLV